MKKKQKRKKWIAEEVKLLREVYPDCSNVKDIAPMFGRDCESLWNKAKLLGIKRKDNPSISNEKFIENGKKHRFTKGHEPYNAKFDGYERISKDGYIEVRVSMGNYRLKHRVVWEKYNGTIPDGMLVKFIDGNPLNTNIDNLYLSSKAENMNANTIHRYPENIKKSIKLIKKLQHEISKS